MPGNGRQYNTHDQNADEVGLVRLAGTVETVVFSNEENGYLVFDLECEGGELVTATGTIPYISEGDSVVLVGRWTHSPKYGRQFRVEQYERTLPADTASILRYLSSRAIKGTGPKPGGLSTPSARTPLRLWKIAPNGLPRRSRAFR